MSDTSLSTPYWRAKHVGCTSSNGDQPCMSSSTGTNRTDRGAVGSFESVAPMLMNELPNATSLPADTAHPEARHAVENARSGTHCASADRQVGRYGDGAAGGNL